MKQRRNWFLTKEIISPNQVLELTGSLKRETPILGQSSLLPRRGNFAGTFCEIGQKCIAAEVA